MAQAKGVWGARAMDEEQMQRVCQLAVKSVRLQYLRLLQLCGKPGDDFSPVSPDSFTFKMAEWLDSEKEQVGVLAKGIDAKHKAQVLGERTRKLEQLHKSRQDLDADQRQWDATHHNKARLEQKMRAFTKLANSAREKFGLDVTPATDQRALLVMHAKMQSNYLEAQNEGMESDMKMKALQDRTSELDQELRERVTKAFRVQSVRMHPDKVAGGATEENLRRYEEVTKAKDVLSDADTRREYVEMDDHDKFVKLKAKIEQQGQKDQSRPDKIMKLTSGTPNKCGMPRTIQAEAGDGIEVSWSYKDASRDEVLHFELHIDMPDGTTKKMVCPDKSTSVHLPSGFYDMRVRAVNLIGPGEWSVDHNHTVTNKQSSAEERKQRLADLQVARVRAHQEALHEARINLQFKMSTAASRSPFAVENLTAAINLSVNAGMERGSQTDQDHMHRAREHLDRLVASQKGRATVKEWKGKLNPFPSAKLLEEMKASDISPEVSNLCYQYISRALREASEGNWRAHADLGDYTPIIEAALMAVSRPDVLKPHWCVEIRDVVKKFEAKIRKERLKREAAEEEKERQLEIARQKLREEDAAFKRRVWQQEEAEQRRRVQELEAAAAERAKEDTQRFYKGLQDEEERRMREDAALARQLQKEMEEEDQRERAGPVPVVYSQVQSIHSQNQKQQQQQKLKPKAKPNGLQRLGRDNETGEQARVREGLLKQATVEVQSNGKSKRFHRRGYCIVESLTDDQIGSLMGQGGMRIAVLGERFKVVCERLGKKGGMRGIVIYGDDQRQVEESAKLAQFLCGWSKQKKLTDWCKCGGCTTPEGCVSHKANANGSVAGRVSSVT
eukprot:CAMPEP_0206215574 /NCGR_PEP_ID=MMETSP0047_2-20121206/2267_1 /ASSEMBLY_ACC=CAM_ASM_000192 /TAXON_ID=195065 /ORGANISM="Chroomonas mesostigmatica_cf, Strain CCMP1168" /LENGTH=841 /DNA_ID=CAMNT_0053637877 /DNA_START=35 /DNA_END=2556 /DNA_ORIENTATION=+